MSNEVPVTRRKFLATTARRGLEFTAAATLTWQVLSACATIPATSSLTGNKARDSLTQTIARIPVEDTKKTRELQKNKYLEEIAGVQVHYQTEPDMFPEHWNKPPATTEAESLMESEIERTSGILRKALDKYPDGFLERHLERIYALHALYFDGAEVGGSNSSTRKSVYITNNGRYKYPEQYIEETFHHELSSILWKKFGKKKFDIHAWRQINPPGFDYSDKYTGGLNTAKEGKSSLKRDVGLLQQGFLNEYAQSNIENDFNEFLAKMFLNDGTFWQDIESYERLKAKVDLVMDFYHSIDPRFTLEYFKKVSTQQF